MGDGGCWILCSSGGKFIWVSCDIHHGLGADKVGLFSGVLHRDGDHCFCSCCVRARAANFNDSLLGRCCSVCGYGCVGTSRRELGSVLENCAYVGSHVTFCIRLGGSTGSDCYVDTSIGVMIPAQPGGVRA